MPKPDLTWKEGDRVRVRGLDGVHVVTRPFSVATPSIVDHQFVLVDVQMVKFITREKTYYALASDCSQAPPEKKEKKR